ncbi:MAG: C1 family peptidase [Cyanobacteria bacterium P01_G01_bin.54]
MDHLSQMLLQIFKTNTYNALQSYDLNRDGVVDLNELTHICQSQGYDFHSAQQIANTVFVQLDTDSNGYITIEDFRPQAIPHVSINKVINTKKFILNCEPSAQPENDWTFEDAIDAGAINIAATAPASKDLRAAWWEVDDQGATGACVGFSTAYGVLRWHYVTAGLLAKSQKPSEKPSARFIWMANKETDNITNYPTTFIEKSGTQTKLALNVARKYGCVTESELPMTGGLSKMSRAAFYSKAAQLRISSFHNLGRDLDKWRSWIANQGPILTRLNVDETWDNATKTNGHLAQYLPNTARGGHAVCLVGYTTTYFIVRNSWGTDWGDNGFAYASDSYAGDAFTEAYGAVL